MSFKRDGGYYRLTDAQYNNLFYGERAAEEGRKGGIKSGETRRRKAEARAAARNTTLKLTADTVYTQWLTDVTKDELKDFIRWRGQKKRKATLAKAALKNLEDDEEEQTERRESIQVLVNRCRFPVKITSWKYLTVKSINFETAREEYKHDYREIGYIFSKIINLYYEAAAACLD